MSFRLRVTLLAAAAVAIAVVAASGIVYVVVRHQLLGEVDTQPRQPRPRLRRAPRARTSTPASSRSGPQANLGGPARLPPGDQRERRRRARSSSPASTQAEELAAEGGRGRSSPTGSVEDLHAAASTHAADRETARRSRSRGRWTRSTDTLHRIGIYLLFIGLGGIGIASALGLLVGQATLSAGRPADRRWRGGDGDARPLAADRGRAPATSSAGSHRRSTQMLERARFARCGPSASSSPTPRTSCGRRSPACGRTSRCSPGARQLPEERAEEAPRRRDRPGRGADRRSSATSSRSTATQPPELEDVRLDELVADRGRPRARCARRRSRSGRDLSESRRPRRRRSSSTGPSRTCSTTRRSGATRSTSRVAGHRGHRARPRPGDRRPRISPTSSTASTGPPQRATCPARASGSRSSGRWRSAHGGDGDRRERAGRRRDLPAPPARWALSLLSGTRCHDPRREQDRAHRRDSCAASLRSSLLAVLTPTVIVGRRRGGRIASRVWMAPSPELRPRHARAGARARAAFGTARPGPEAARSGEAQGVPAAPGRSRRRADQAR